MKTPTTSDFFALGRILADLNVKEDIKRVSDMKGADTFSIGYELIMSILEKASQKSAEKQIYSFLAMTSEKTEEDLQDPNTFLDCITEIINSEEWRALFSRVAGLIVTK